MDGTNIAAIVGGFLALYLYLNWKKKSNKWWKCYCFYSNEWNR